MEDYIPISTLNDFIFCPYSIYLHNVYMETDEGLYHATPQTRGKIAHETIDNKKASNRADDLQSLPVMSDEYGLMGKIDIYKGKEHKLIERKYQLRNIFKGQIYQLWAQYLCMKEMGWSGRKPRIKSDYINATLDIGYTYLFNFIECFVRMFGFDIYVGVYHRLWFKRKSLICDLMEPFRCIVDRTTRTAINKKQFSEKDFDIHKGEYRLKIENNKVYSQVFFDSIVPYKSEIFRYIQSYYRCFMGKKDIGQYPKFCLQ